MLIARPCTRLDEGHFGIFDVFPDNGGRFAHLTGHVPPELATHSLSLPGSVPDVGMLDVVDAKWPPRLRECGERSSRRRMRPDREPDPPVEIGRRVVSSMTAQTADW